VIQRTAVGYFKEGLRVSLKAIGGDPDALDFILGTELYHNNDRYWETLIEVSKDTTLNRVKRSVSILGREEDDEIAFAKLIYPPMQVADIFMMGVYFAQGGMDQRKAHVIARDVALHMTVSPLRDANGKTIKPIALHNHLILGLQKPSMWPIPPDQVRELWTSMKMSKSKPNAAVFIHDTPDEIRSKIRKAFCPPGETEFNPILDWANHLLFHNDIPALDIKRTPENGGDVHFSTYDELCTVYKSGALHPSDLKNAVADAIVDLLAPVRAHFAGEDMKRMWDELEKLL
jgi:tyrosyl-tRNA synthetase